MFQRFTTRPAQYLLLLIVSATLFLPNLGAPSLWDIDEGNNAEAAREMFESGNWIVPTFNYELRTDKPALLYWAEGCAYHFFGVNEFSARLPSALAAMLCVLLVCEMGRQMFDPATGLLAGLVLSSTIGFGAAAHFANPDALLGLSTALTFFLAWRSLVTKRAVWLSVAGCCAGLAVLAKGPVGIVLPAAAIGAFLLWSRGWKQILDRSILWALLCCAAVSLPWFIWVGVETRGQYLAGFLGVHNVDRFLRPMENHNGPLYYYLAVLLLGFAPWSVFVGPTCWYALGQRVRADQATLTRREAHPYAFLWCWIAVYLLFFSLARTKLPNYILPIYVPLALLTGRWFVRWRNETIQMPGWIPRLGLTCLALLGIGFSLGMAVASGRLAVPALRGRFIPGLASSVALGVFPLIFSLLAWRQTRKNQRGQAIAWIASASIVFSGGLFAWSSLAVDERKAPRYLTVTGHACNTEEEVRVACFNYFQPSVVFYCQREVQKLDDEGQAVEFLRTPLESFLFMPVETWSGLSKKVPAACRVLASHYDLYRNCEVVLVGNR